MRLSITKGSEAYQPPHITRLAVVTLDGVVQNSCICADEERGYVVRYKRLCVKGLPVSGNLPTERVLGTVVISWPKDFDKGRLIQSAMK